MVMNTTVPKAPEVQPGVSAPACRVRRARTAADVHAAQSLRFSVFNLELNEGLEQSFDTLLDADPFDEICDHLLVEDLASGEVVGTYRLQTGENAARRRGYYSAQEFDLAPLDPFRAQVIELGRACVAKSHRNLAVVSMLWRGIAQYAREHGGRYLVGCSSIHTQDAAVGASLYSSLIRRHLVSEPFIIPPLPEVACPLDRLAAETPEPPKLFATYLAIGAKICGAPAIDREFKTVDFLTLLDLESLPRRVAQRFLG
jgi:putative hemolysin